jgi:hypothetical protein
MSAATDAFALLGAYRDGRTVLTRKAGSFLGQCITDPSPLTDRQAEWLTQLLEKAGLRPSDEVIHRD